MLEIIRYYKNNGNDTLRVDTIHMERTNDPIARVMTEQTYARRLRVTQHHGPADRVIKTISMVGNYDTTETSSGNFLWATWTSPSAQVDMSDLPVVTDTL